MEQESFSRLWDGYKTDKEALNCRNMRAKWLRKNEGKNVRCWTLRNQLKKYSGLGIEDGRSCNVYMIDVL